MSGLASYRQLLTGAAVVAIAVATPAMAQTRTFNVPEGPASRTIPIFAKQAGAQIIGSATVLRAKRTRAVKGVYTLQEGLRLLLSGTDLTPDTNGDVITIGLVEGNGRDASTGADADGAGRAEILVIGSRSRNVDVRRTEDDDQPYSVFNREEIESSQATTVEEFLLTRVTQLTRGSTGSQSQTTGSGKPYSNFNLRGLGSNQTLILVNGRRLANLANQNFAPSQADINGIPLGSIERIEVLPTSAGGIYGGNAVGGVINIILRSDYRGIEIGATYNDSFDFRAPNGRLDVNGGFALEHGRTTVTFGGAISRSGTLRVGDRPELIKDGIDLYRRNVDIVAGTGTPPLGAGVNIRSATGANLVLKPAYGGGSLNSTITNVPLGYGGVGSDNGAALLAGAGKFNLDIPTDLQGLKRGLLTSPRVESFNISVRRKFSSLFDLFVDYSHLENHGISYSANQIPQSVNLSAGAPTNPFQQNIRVTFLSPNFSFPFDQASNTDTLSVGTIVRLPHNWAANAEYNKTWTSNRGVYYQAVIDAVGTNCLNLGTTPCAGGAAINPLQPIDFGPYLFTSPTFLAGPYRSAFANPSLRLSGPLFKLPGGSATLTGAVQQETTTIELARNSIVNANTRGRTYVIFPGRKQSTTSEYGEVVLPLISPSNGVPLVREFELRGAIRHDSYLTEAPPPGDSFIDYSPSGGAPITQLSGFGSFTTSNANAVIPSYTPVRSRFRSTDYTFAGRWSPIKGVMFRASYATGFLPPSVVQIASQQFSAPFGLGIPDPQRSNETINYPIIQYSGSGSSSLRPELSKSLSGGVILTPFEGVRFSADYTRIRKTDEVGAIPYDFLLSHPDLFPGRVTREASAGGVPGRIISLDVTPVNLYHSSFETVDFQFDYNLDTASAGKFRFYALATWQPHAQRALVPAAGTVEYSDRRDGPLKWQGNGGIDWTLGKLGVRWNTQFYNSYRIYSGADSAGTVTALIAQQGARRVPAQSYSDLYMSYDFKDAGGVLNGMRISAGVQNIFDKKPPVIAISSYTNQGYSAYGDPRLRRFTLTLRKAFGNH